MCHQWPRERQVISRSENPQARSPGVTGIARIFSGGAVFTSKKLTTFLVVAVKTQAVNAADCFTVKTRNSSGDEIANVNFLYDDIVHAVKIQ